MDLQSFRQALRDRYTLEDQIGQGGMAHVFRARDHKHDRPVAIKILKPELGSALGSARFLEEIRVTANLHHPHLLPLFDSGEVDGLLYYVMPLVRGESLRARIGREGAMPVGEAVRIITIVADAVDHAHRQGVVHRDLKPENILLVDGQPLVADFGIALAISEAAATRMTGTGLSVGTPQYMSPEQAAGERTIDARSDVYALGAILYEMLTGAPPHAGASAQAVLAKVLTERPPTVRSQRDSVPAALDEVVTRALARLPADRWQTAAQFARGVETASAGRTSDEVTPSPRPAAARRVLVGGLFVLVAAAVGVTVWRQASDPIPSSTASPASAGLPSSLAVLPFENRSADKADEYFSDGLTEELLHRLAQVPRLRVAARTSSFAFKGKDPELQEIASRLNVEAVVSGSVRRSGEVLRVTVQLIDLADGRPLWSQSYERTVHDAFRVQDEIAQAIVQRLDPESSAPRRSEGPSPAAFDLYLQGRYEWNRRTPEGAAAAIDLLQRAIRLAPDYARAHAALAEAYAVSGFYDYMAPRIAFTRAKEAADRAAALDPALAEAPNTLGYVALYHEWDFARAEREFQRAIMMSPRYAVAHQWHANLLTVAGRFTEAADAMRTAQELDPLAPIPHAALGWVYLHARDYRSAEAHLRRTLTSHPGYFLAQLWLAEALEGQARFPEALAAADDALRTSAGNVVAQLVRARILVRLRRGDEARAILTRIEAQAALEYVPAYPRALVRIALGHTDDAFALLDRAAADGAHAIAFLRVDPLLDPLRRDPRFQALVARTLKSN